MRRNRPRLESFGLALLASVSLTLPSSAAELLSEVVLSESANSAPGLASDLGDGVIATWAEVAPAGSSARNRLLARRLHVDLSTRSTFEVANDAGGPETFFFCPNAVRIGSDRIAFTWLTQTAAGGRIGQRVMTDQGVPVGPVRYADLPTGDREHFCPSVDGGVRGFAVAWASGRKGRADKTAIYARSFDTSGAPISDQLLVQSETNAITYPPGIAIDRRDHFTVAWTVLGPGHTTPVKVRMRRYLENGVPTARTIEVTRNTGVAVALASFGKGEGVEIAFTRDRAARGLYVQLQRFDRQLRPIAPPRRVAVASDFGLPSLAVDASGKSALTWDSAAPREIGLFANAGLAACEPPFPIHPDRPTSLTRVAFASPDEAVFALIVEDRDGNRRLVARSFSLAACGR